MINNTESQLMARVEDVLESLRPFLKSDGGDVELVGIKDNQVSIKLLGACSSCEMSHFTMKAGIEEGIKKSIPEIDSVIAI